MRGGFGGDVTMEWRLDEGLEDRRGYREGLEESDIPSGEYTIGRLYHQEEIPSRKIEKGTPCRVVIACYIPHNYTIAIS